MRLILNRTCFEYVRPDLIAVMLYGRTSVFAPLILSIDFTVGVFVYVICITDLFLVTEKDCISFGFIFRDFSRMDVHAFRVTLWF